MKNKELFDKTISILVKAYQNGTLIHGYLGLMSVIDTLMVIHGFEDSVLVDTKALFVKI